MDQPEKPQRASKVSASSYSTKTQPFMDFDKFKDFNFGRPRLPRRLRVVSAIVLACLLAGFGGGWLGAIVYNHGNNGVATIQAAKQQYISNESQLIESIAKNVGQSVVSIDVQGQNTATDFFGFVQPQTTQSAGTGFIISASGIIVTNRHVVPAGTTSVSVVLSDGTRYDNVQVLARTSDSSSQDVAFLKIG